MKYLKTFESYHSLINFDSKAKDLEEEKEEAENLKNENEIQRLKNEREEQDEELKRKRRLFRRNKKTI